MKWFWLITLAVCFGYIRNMFPKVVKAAKDSYGECYFKCKNSIECNKRCGQLCRTFGECDMCEADSDNCSKCVCNKHKQ